MQRVYEQRKVKHATCKNVKGRVLEDSNAIGDTDVFGVVPIGGCRCQNQQISGGGGPEL